MPPVTKVSFPLSSTVTANNFSKVTPAANGCPGLLQKDIIRHPIRYGQKKFSLSGPAYLSRSSYLM